MPTPIEYSSFLVRLWRPIGSDSAHPSTGWRGEVEHIQSGEHRDLEALDELLESLRDKAEDSRVTGSVPSE